MACWLASGAAAPSTPACRRRPHSRDGAGRAMSLRAELLRLGLRTFLKRRSRGFEVEAWRRGMHRTAPLVPRPPSGTDITVVHAGELRMHRATTARSRAAGN